MYYYEQSDQILLIDSQNELIFYRNKLKRKQAMPGIEQKNIQISVRNLNPLRRGKAYQRYTKILIGSNLQFDPHLTAAIVRRNISGIKSSINKFYNGAEQRETLRNSQYEALTNFYGKQLVANPVKLALRICDSDAIETTLSSEPTRFDVLHCLAENFDTLIEFTRQKNYAQPELADILEYAISLNRGLPLHTFILGLSEARKAEAAQILR